MNFREVWEKEQMVRILDDPLAVMIALDGFDSGAGEITKENWLRYVEWIKAILGIEVGDSIFEVGCGAGAFLYPFWEQDYVVAGMDYSEPLIKSAREIMPDMSFSIGEANSFLRRGYDFVVSNSVFQYFPDLEYAEQVLGRMIKGAVKKVMICDIPNLDLKAQSENFRRSQIPDYDIKYKGLEHLYYSQSWFREKLVERNCKFMVLEQNIIGYGNNPFRFNVVISK